MSERPRMGVFSKLENADMSSFITLSEGTGRGGGLHSTIQNIIL